jgi:hypothetical protein
MSDLTIVAMQMCAQMDQSVFMIKSETDPNKTYVVTYFTERQPHHCTCPAFRNKKRWVNDSSWMKRNYGWCKHLEQVDRTTCQWHEQYGEAQEISGTCPLCQGPTVSVRVGV